MLAKRTLLQLIILLVIWRCVLFFIGKTSQLFFEYAPSFPYAEGFLHSTQLPQWLYSWGNFDGVHYITIAQEGYNFAGLSQAFFPVYPLLMRLIQAATGLTYVTTGLIISHLFFILFIIVFFQYVAQRFNQQLAWKSVLTFLLYPTSFFLVGIYTESLFLFLVILSFLLARNKMWFWAGCCVAIASATRLVGIFLVPALAVDLFFQQYQITRSTPINEVLRIIITFIRKSWRALLGISVGVTGLSLYMLFLWIDFKDPLYFFHVQSEFGANRSESIVTLPQVMYRYLKILLTVRPIDWKYFSYVQDLFLTIGVLGLLGVGVVKRSLKIKVSELVFSFAAFLLPTLTGTFSSMPRYVLVCFPIFFIIPQLFEKKPVFYTYLGISGIVLIVNIMLFIQGYWIS